MKKSNGPYNYAKLLASAIWTKHYKKDGHPWKPNRSTIGLLTQIDNMVTGLTRKEDPPEQLGSQTFQPLTITVDVNTLRTAANGCVVGAQYARDTLEEHDRKLGRTTLKNLRWAVSMETDIEKFGELQAVLEKLIGDH